MGNEPSSQPPSEISHSSAATTGDDISVLTYDQSAARSQEHRARMMDAASVADASKDTSVTARVSYGTAKSKACPACFARIGLDASFCQACEDAVRVDLDIEERNRAIESNSDSKKAAMNLRKCPACQGTMKHNSEDQWCKDCQAAMLMDDDAGDDWKSSSANTPAKQTTVEEAAMSPPPSKAPPKVTPNNSQDSFQNSTASLNASAKQEACLVCQTQFAPTNPSVKLCNICLGVALEDHPTQSTKFFTKQEHRDNQLNNSKSNQGLPSRFINPYNRHKQKNDHSCSHDSIGLVSENKNYNATPHRSATTTSRVTPSPSSIQKPYGRQTAQQQPNSSHQSATPQRGRVCQDCGVSTDADWKVRCLSCWSTWKNNQKADTNDSTSIKRRLDFRDNESGRGDRKTGKTTAEV